MATQASPQTWTLRFKHHKTTIFLHVDKTQTLSSIKTELLAALHETLPSGTLHETPLPTSPSAIVFARPKDPNDLEAGWESLEHALLVDDGMFDEEPGKGKGRSKARASANGGGGGATGCPLGAGLKDGGAVAFKFRDRDGDVYAYDEDEDMGLEEREGAWDVLVPKYEDVYGVEELQERLAMEGVTPTAA